MTYFRERCPNCDYKLPPSGESPLRYCPYCEAMLDDSERIPPKPSSTSAERKRASAEAPPAFEISGRTLVKYHGVDRMVTVPNGIQTIGNGAFQGCDRIRQIQIPNDVLDIEPCAFKGCTSLKTITLSFRLKTIGEYAFQDCKALENLRIPINVETIGKGTFYGCGALNEINCDREDLLPSDAFEDFELEECFTYTTFNEWEPCSCGCGELQPVRKYQRLPTRIPKPQRRARRIADSDRTEGPFKKIKLGR